MGIKKAQTLPYSSQALHCLIHPMEEVCANAHTPWMYEMLFSFSRCKFERKTSYNKFRVSFETQCKGTKFSRISMLKQHFFCLFTLLIIIKSVVG